MCLVLPYEVDQFTVFIPERLLELKKDLVVGPKAHSLDGVRFVQWKRRAQKSALVLLQVSCNETGSTSAELKALEIL